MVPKHNTRPATTAETRSIKDEFKELSEKLELARLQLILTPEGFNTRYEEVQRDFPLKKSEDIYETVEAEHKGITGKRKYSNFDSFRQIRKRIIRGLKAEK